MIREWLERLQEILKDLPKVETEIMNETAVELLAKGMTYVFAAFLFLLVIAAVLSYRERASWHPESEEVFGYLRIRHGREIQNHEITADTSVGRSRQCDVRLRTKDIAKWHARFYATGRGIYISRLSGDRIVVNDHELKRREKLNDGDTVILGETSMIFHEAARDGYDGQIY